MIEKIISIKNIAKFRDYSPRGDVEFNPLTLIYSENALGKTTLVDIFRSLTSGDPSSILAKHTISESEPPEVRIKQSAGISNFRNGMWDKTLKDILIFDSNYVNLNVFSGDHVEHSHKKNLYYLVIGEKGVQLAKEINVLDSEIRVVSGQIKDKSSEIQNKIIGDLDLNLFISLQSNENINQNIKEKEAIIETLKNSNEIENQPSLSEIIWPEINFQEIRDLLGKSIENVAKDAEAQVKNHCQSIGVNGENWVREGFDLLKALGGDCPFCGQSVSGNSLINAYSHYFSVAYKDLKKEIDSLFPKIKEQFCEDTILQIQGIIKENQSLSSFWIKFVPDNYPNLDFEDIKLKRYSLFASLGKVFETKKINPLDQVIIPDELEDAIYQYLELDGIVETYNSKVKNINEKLDEKKNSVSSGSINDEKNILNLLLNTRNRFSPEISSLCDEYKQLEQSKIQKTQEKGEKRNQLNNIIDRAISQYQSALNKFLGDFGVGFQIAETETSFQGGLPSISYQLIINGEGIQLGTYETIDRPSFKTTLSAGEKTTLAFSFFLAQIEQDTDINEKIIIIDDPITSLDDYRRTCTEQEIVKIANKAKQVIVLSHDPFFLRNIRDNFLMNKTLRIRRAEQGSLIEECNLNIITRTPYLKDYFRLDNFLNEAVGDPHDVVRCIRPVLEHNLRDKFPKEFNPGEWLGDYIGKISKAEVGEPIFIMKSKLDELSCINIFSKKYHHDTDPNWSNNLQNITNGVLEPWVIRTINLIQAL